MRGQGNAEFIMITNLDMSVWVDDIRTPPDDNGNWFWAKNSTQAIWFLNESKKRDRKPVLVSLDHDLGGDDDTRPVVLWMIENDFWPNKMNVHSANVVGIEWLEGMIERYGPEGVLN